MYAYLVDNLGQDRHLQAELFKVEARLAQLGIQGRTEKITILKNLVESARDAVRRGATTIVAIGSDATVIKLLPVAIEENVSLGIIPLTAPSSLAEYLGIPFGAAACDVLARRIVRRVDVGKADNQYFLREARVESRTPVECDGAYTISIEDPQAHIVIGNLGPNDSHGQPTDGRLELLVQTDADSGWPFRKSQGTQSSVIPIRTASLKGKSADTSLLLDGEVLVKGATTIEVAKKKLGIIVGRDRKF